MTFTLPPLGIGAIIALGVLVVTIVLFIVDDPLSRNQILGLIGALAIARLVP